MIDVLLVSPRLPPNDPRFGGDHTYTEMLLSHPPEEVRYFHYEDLQASGQVRTHRLVNALASRLRTYGVIPPDLWAVYLISDFVPDLVHVYGFSARISFCKKPGIRIPVILSQGTGGAADLLCYLGWEDRRARRARRIESLCLRFLRVYNSSLNPRDASRILVWSGFSRRMHLWDGVVKHEQIEVLAPGLPVPPCTREDFPRNGTTFLFIGSDFARKNGYLALEAFRRVRQDHPTSHLLLIGAPRETETIVEDGVIHHRFVPRHELYTCIYPQADVLLLPSRAEGFGLVLLEAMSFGLPVIAVDAWAMPEIVVNGENGFLIPPNSVDALADRMARLAGDAELVAAMGRNSRRLFQQRFSIDRHNARLLQIYREVLGSRRT